VTENLLNCLVCNLSSIFLFDLFSIFLYAFGLLLSDYRIVRSWRAKITLCVEPGQCFVDGLFGSFCVCLGELVARLDLVQNLSSLQQRGLLGRSVSHVSVTWVHWICGVRFVW
jgi:hypothetical protein